MLDETTYVSPASEHYDRETGRAVVAARSERSEARMCAAKDTDWFRRRARAANRRADDEAAAAARWHTLALAAELDGRGLDALDLGPGSGDGGRCAVRVNQRITPWDDTPVTWRITIPALEDDAAGYPVAVSPELTFTRSGYTTIPIHPYVRAPLAAEAITAALARYAAAEAADRITSRLAEITDEAQHLRDMLADLARPALP